MVLQITIFDTKIEYFLPRKIPPIWDPISLSVNPNLPIWVQENITCMVEVGTSLSSPPLLTFVQWWEGGPFQDFRTKFVPRSYFRTLLHTDRKFFMIYMQKRDKVDLFFSYLQLNQGDVASVRPVFQEARFGHFLSRNKCQTLIKQWNEPRVFFYFTKLVVFVY